MEATISTNPLLTETINTIYTRRAIRKYKKTKPTREIIENILDAGRMAPSAMNTQPWKFYVITDITNIELSSKQIARVAAHDLLKISKKQLLKNIKRFLTFTHISDLFNGAEAIFHGAPVVIFITSAKGYEWAGLDIGMCAQNMMLAAKSLGLDSCPVGLAKYAERTTLYPKLNIPANEQVHIAVIIGYGNEKPELHERKQDNAFFID